MIKVFDGHCDTLFQCCRNGGGLRSRPGHLDLERLSQLGQCAQFFAVFGAAEDFPGRDLWTVFLEQQAIFQRETEANRDLVCRCRTGGEAKAALAKGKTAAFLSVEGADLLNCDLDRLEEAWRLGVRAVNLTWNHANPLSGSSAEEPERGLSARGRAFVRRMEELGMLVDVSHLSDRGFWDVADCTERPFFASHSNSRTVFFHPRNLTDRQFTAIIERNGVAGINLYANFLGENPDVDTVVAHIEHFWALGGERNVSLGGDWDGCAPLAGGITDVRSLEKLYDRLIQRNYGTSLLDGLFFNNLMRVVNEVCTM